MSQFSLVHTARGSRSATHAIGTPYDARDCALTGSAAASWGGSCRIAGRAWAARARTTARASPPSPRRATVAVASATGSRLPDLVVDAAARRHLALGGVWCSRSSAAGVVEHAARNGFQRLDNSMPASAAPANADHLLFPAVRHRRQLARARGPHRHEPVPGAKGHSVDHVDLTDAHVNRDVHGGNECRFSRLAVK